MARPKLWKLNPMDFTKMNPTRQAKIEAAPAKELPPVGSYKPNQIANALHPKAQYLKVAEVVERGGDAKSFWLEADAARGTEALAWFSAGQYLSIVLDVNGKKLTRPYSLASSPREALDGRYMLTVKRVEGGLASQFILDNWQVGTEVTASEPLGVFTYEPLRDAKTVIGVAGGSGITPFRSLAKSIAEGDEDAELILLMGTDMFLSFHTWMHPEQITKNASLGVAAVQLGFPLPAFKNVADDLRASSCAISINLFFISNGLIFSSSRSNSRLSWLLQPMFFLHSIINSIYNLYH